MSDLGPGKVNSRRRTTPHSRFVNVEGKFRKQPKPYAGTLNTGHLGMRSEEEVTSRKKSVEDAGACDASLMTRYKICPLTVS